jgi:hypothetical protein
MPAGSTGLANYSPRPIIFSVGGHPISKFLATPLVHDILFPLLVTPVFDCFFSSTCLVDDVLTSFVETFSLSVTTCLFVDPLFGVVD